MNRPGFGPALVGAGAGALLRPSRGHRGDSRNGERQGGGDDRPGEAAATAVRLRLEMGTLRTCMWLSLRRIRVWRAPWRGVVGEVDPWGCCRGFSPGPSGLSGLHWRLGRRNGGPAGGPPLGRHVGPGSGYNRMILPCGIPKVCAPGSDGHVHFGPFSSLRPVCPAVRLPLISFVPAVVGLRPGSRRCRKLPGLDWPAAVGPVERWLSRATMPVVNGMAGSCPCTFLRFGGLVRRYPQSDPSPVSPVNRSPGCPARFTTVGRSR